MRRSVVLAVTFVVAAIVVVSSVYLVSRCVACYQRRQVVEAVQNGDLKAVMALVHGNASLVDAEWQDRLAMFPEPILNMAIRTRQREIADFLIHEGADVNRRDGLLQRAPLHSAAEWGDIEVVRLLLEKGADPNDHGGGATPVVLAVHAGNSRAAMVLKQSGAEPGSCIHEAAAFGNLRSVERELRRDPNLIKLEEYGSRPLDLAAKHGHLGIVRYLIAEGAPIIPPALLYAAESGHLEIVRTLVAHGADVNARMDSVTAYTPLHGAAESGNVEVVAYLLTRGTDPSLRSGGYTAIDLARKTGRDDVVDLLRPRCEAIQEKH